MFQGQHWRVREEGKTACGLEGMLQCEGLRTLDESGVQVKSYEMDYVCYSSYKKSWLYLLICDKLKNWFAWHIFLVL